MYLLLLTCLGPALVHYHEAKMASDRQVEDLKAQIANLQARVDKLESEKHAQSSSKSEAMRMILIGPPGAGMSRNCLNTGMAAANTLSRKRNASSKDQGQVLCLPLGMTSL